MTRKGTEPFTGDLHVDTTQWSSAECGLYSEQLQVSARNECVHLGTYTHSFFLSLLHYKPHMHTLLKRNYPTLNTSSATPEVLWRRNQYILWQRGETLQKRVLTPWVPTATQENSSANPDLPASAWPFHRDTSLTEVHSLPCCADVTNFLIFSWLTPWISHLESSLPLSPSSSLPPALTHQLQSPLNVHLQDICKLYLKR